MKIYRWLGSLVVLVVMLLIFSLSAQPAVESRSLSGPLVVRLKAKVEASKLIPKDMKEAFFKAPSFWVRKLAHVSIYFLLGFVLYLALPTRRWGMGKSFLLAVGICAVYALGDEWHQLFVLGRSAELRDIILDSMGALGGILLGWLIKKVASFKMK